MILFSSDWHLTSRRIDEYRWEMFDWTADQIEHFGLRSMFILGDLTDKKDRHPAKLVNRLVRRIRGLGKLLPDGLHILMGNHDYEDPSSPFFMEVLPRLDNVYFYHRPKEIVVAGVKFLMVPHAFDSVTFTSRKDLDWKGQDVICFHQTFKGAKASNGMKMRGILGKEMFRRLGVPFETLCLSGDIHVPQKIGRVTYVGSPYPVAFGDSFEPRCLLLDPEDLDLYEVERPSIKRTTFKIEDPSELFADEVHKEGDQVKIILQLPRSRVGEWKALKRQCLNWCITRGVSLRGIILQEKKGIMPNFIPGTRAGRTPPTTILKRYADAQGLTKSQVAIGTQLLEDAK